MAGRFPLYSDADIDGRVVSALIRAGWSVMRAVDAHPEKTPDRVHFESAAKQRRVYLANDRDIPLIAHEWLAAGRAFRGLVWWPRSHYRTMGPGDFVAEFEGLAQEDDPFQLYPILYLKRR